MVFSGMMRPHLDCTRLGFPLSYPKTNQLSLAQSLSMPDIASADEDVDAIGHGNEPKPLAGVEPLDHAPTWRNGQKMSTTGAMLGLMGVLPLFPARPHKCEAAMLAGKEPIGGKLKKDHIHGAEATKKPVG